MNILKLLLKVGGWLMVFFAVVTLVAAFFVYRHARHFVDTASRAQGTVTKMVERSGHDSQNVFCPVYTFQDSQGKQHEIYSTGGSYPPAYKVGDKVPVLYQPDSPEKAEIDSFLEVWLFSAILAGFGIMPLLIGLGLLIVSFFIARAERRRLTVHATS